MKTTARVSARILGAMLLAGCAAESGDDGAATSAASLGVAPGGPVAPDPAFYVEALGRMCLDVGAQASWAVGSPVSLYWCNGSAAQQVAVREVSIHDVTLRVGSQFCIGAHGGVAVAGAALELQLCSGSDAQEFALDGDSIIAGRRKQLRVGAAPRASSAVGSPLLVLPIERELVVKPLGDLTAAKTPLVLGARASTEPEYLRFRAVDGSNRPPHSGFVRPSNGTDLVTMLRAATWGTVVELVDGTYDVTTPETPIASGVTLRGYRKLTDNGPQITYNDDSQANVFTVAANDVRITGLRIQGPSNSTEANRVLTGIAITDGYRVTVDHVELSNFTASALIVYGTDTEIASCPNPFLPAPRPTTVKVIRNFSHNNEANQGGYGFASWTGAFPLFQGNVEYMNRHSIACDYRGSTGYVAMDNLVLSQAPSYYLWGIHSYHDFDVHGSDNPWWSSSQFEGGTAGDYVQIQWNTFLGTGRENVKIRGQQCRTGLLDGNVFRQSRGDAVDTLDYNGDTVDPAVNFDVTSNNAFDSDDPTNDLAVGDFDGDGVDDVFLGTGIGWYYSSGAQGEWRHLRRATERASNLRFADLDGDGRTDVVTVHTPGVLDVSWGGVSSWRVLTSLPAAVPITSIAVGNFDGDTFHGDDLFLTNGSAWFVAPSGRGWLAAQTSSFPMSALRFGDFDGDGRTDVFAISGGKYSISSAAQGRWTALGGPSTTDIAPIVVGDFNGDGTADVGVSTFLAPRFQFYVSLGGRGAFELSGTTLSPIIAHGRFEGGPRHDTLFWNGDGQSFVAGAGVGAPFQLWSRQDMR